jgi:hypothetical protein
MNVSPCQRYGEKNAMGTVISKNAFKKALMIEPITETQRKMLKANYRSSNHSISASEMARLFHWESYSAANLKYGGLAKLISERLNLDFQGEQYLSLLVDFVKPLNEWHWVLKSELSTALEELGWVNGEEVPIVPEELPQGACL